MRTILIVTAALGVIAGCAEGNFTVWKGNGDMHQYEETKTFDEPTDGLNSLDITTRNGAIELRGEDTDAARVVATKRLRAPSEERAREYAEEVYTEITRSGDTLVVKTIRPDQQPRDIESAGISYIVTLPKRFAAKIETRNGAVEVRELQGVVGADTRNGAIKLHNVGSVSDIVTRNGGINANLSNLMKDAAFESRNGSIDVRIAEGARGTVTLDTRNGAITLKSPELGAAKVETKNGAVNVSVSERLGGDVDIATSNGSVELSTPRDAGFQLEARASRGRIDTDWGDAKASFETTVNGGGFRVTVRTSGGRIRVHGI